MQVSGIYVNKCMQQINYSQYYESSTTVMFQDTFITPKGKCIYTEASLTIPFPLTNPGRSLICFSLYKSVYSEYSI